MSGAKMAIQRFIFICKRTQNILSDSGSYELCTRNCFVVYIDGNSSVTHSAKLSWNEFQIRFEILFKTKVKYMWIEYSEIFIF